jgi:hypothetical protein
MIFAEGLDQRYNLGWVQGAVRRSRSDGRALILRPSFALTGLISFRRRGPSRMDAADGCFRSCLDADIPGAAALETPQTVRPAGSSTFSGNVTHLDEVTDIACRRQIRAGGASLR